MLLNKQTVMKIITPWLGLQDTAPTVFRCNILETEKVRESSSVQKYM